MDQVLALAEISKSDWIARATSVRIALSALWSLVYEEGPGKSEFAQTITGSSPKAYFQVAADKNALLLRLCYTMSSWSPKDTLAHFWPDAKALASPAQLLLRYCDFTRVHIVSETNDVEIVAGFLASKPSEKTPNEVRTFWVEPLAPNLISEIPFEAPGPDAPQLKPLSATAGISPQKAARNLETEFGSSPSQSQSEDTDDTIPAGDPTNPPAHSKDRFLIRAAKKIQELKALLLDRDQTIRELRSGGVGTSKPLPPPDAEALLEAFQGKYFEAKYQIRQIELKIVEMETQGATPAEVQALKMRMAELAAREREWIKTLAATIDTLREAKKA
jgi:hypothetical protein